MTKIAIICAAAGVLLADPSVIAPASAAEGVKVAQVDVRIGAGDPDRRWHRHRRDCSKTVIYRHGRKTVITRCR